MFLSLMLEWCYLVQQTTRDVAFQLYTKGMIKVLFFASLREVTQTRELERPLSTIITVRQLAEQLQEEFPSLSLSGSLCAINEDYAKPDDLIHAGDTVAFLPPVSGG